MPDHFKPAVPSEQTAAELELLKERIYATLAVLAILLTLDTQHSTPLRAAITVAGTALSLWAASLLAARMAYRIIMQKGKTDYDALRHHLVRHSPLLLAAVLPLFAIALAYLGVISLSLAVDLATGMLILFILGLSLLSARTVRAGKFYTLVLALAEVAIGLGVVGLKIVAGH
ncbi:MAG: hypothetical protein NVSMB39_0090 [Candidatus Saccharimonadales bacterium]